MKKLITLLLTTLFFASCMKDDDGVIYFGKQCWLCTYTTYEEGPGYFSNGEETATLCNMTKKEIKRHEKEDLTSYSDDSLYFYRATVKCQLK